MSLQLASMGETQHQIIDYVATADKAIQAILLQLEKDTRPLIEQLAEQEREAAAYAEENAVELQDKGKKSAKLVTGVVKWLSGGTSLVDRDKKATIAKIRKDGRLKKFTAVPERVINKEALKANPAYVATIPSLEITNSAGVSFTPSHTNVAVEATYKVVTGVLKALGSNKAKESAEQD